jgi:hypothetical protein
MQTALLGIKVGDKRDEVVDHASVVDPVHQSPVASDLVIDLLASVAHTEPCSIYRREHNLVSQLPLPGRAVAGSRGEVIGCLEGSTLRDCVVNNEVDFK